MERYVNNGSPSGFTEKYTSSPTTSPFGQTPSFTLHAAVFSPSLVEDLGTIPTWLQAGHVLLHPDMAREPLITSNSLEICDTTINVTPTASARTVELLDSEHAGFVKLNYKGLLGRVDRQLSKGHALSALDVTEILECAVRDRNLPDLFSFLRESGARVTSLSTPTGTLYEWGTVFRESDPYPPRKTTTFLVPAFSLFATDRMRPQDPILLTQLGRLQTKAPDEYVFTNIIAPIVTCYFELLLRHALQFECNAQNILLGFDQHGDTTMVLFRDFESVDKDLSLAEDLNLKVTFKSSPFKCVHRDLYNYSIKHSFMYDFKLGEYVLTPIIATISNQAARVRVTQRTKELGQAFIRRLPHSFFPSDGQWYTYANVVVDKTAKRPYVGVRNPTYR